MAMRRTASLSLFGESLLPAVALPFHGYLAESDGSWLRFCPGYQWFNAYTPASWANAYRDGQMPSPPPHMRGAISRAWGDWRRICPERAHSFLPASWGANYQENT
jgi:hypothetical protein